MPNKQEQMLLDPLQSRFEEGKKVTMALWPTKDIVENWWNPNEMKEGDFQSLGEDMKAGGPAAIDPIKCAHLDLKKFHPDNNALAAIKKELGHDPNSDTLITIDGVHRLRQAQRLGWEKMRIELDDTVPDEGWARILTYTKNRERGSLNEWKEAENFKYFAENQKLTQEEIAKQFHIEKSTVSRRLALLKLDPDVKKALSELSRPISVSKLETLTPLKPEAQRLATAEIARVAKFGEVSVEEVNRIAERAKEHVAEKEALANLMNAPNTVQKTCPKCGKPPNRVSHNKAPFVRCEEYDEWDVTKKSDKKPSKEKEEPEEKQRENKIDYIRTTHEFKEFSGAFTEFAKEFVPKFDYIELINCRCRIKGESAEIDITNYTDHVTLSSRSGEKDGKLFLKVEHKQYRVAALKHFRAVVHTMTGGHSLSAAKQKELDEFVGSFLKKYASKKKA